MGEQAEELFTPPAKQEPKRTEAELLDLGGRFGLGGFLQLAQPVRPAALHLIAMELQTTTRPQTHDHRVESPVGVERSCVANMGHERVLTRSAVAPPRVALAEQLCDRFSIVAGGDSIVAEGELPATWGLLVARGNKLVVVKQAPLLPGADLGRDISRSFLVCLLRSAGAVPEVEPAAVTQARFDGIEEGHRQAEELVGAWRDKAAEANEAIHRFEDASGIDFGTWHRLERADEIGRAVRLVLESDGAVTRARNRLLGVQRGLREAAADLDRLLVDD